MNKTEFYFEERVPFDDMNRTFDDVDNSIKHTRNIDELCGIKSGLGITPGGGVSVNLGLGLAYSKSGIRMPNPGAIPIDLTSYVPAATFWIVSIFMKPKMIESDPRVDGHGNLLYYYNEESYEIVLESDGEGAPVHALDTENILLADVTITVPGPVVTIDVTTRREDCFKLTGMTVLPDMTEGTVKDIITELTNQTDIALGALASPEVVSTLFKGDITRVSNGGITTAPDPLPLQDMANDIDVELGYRRYATAVCTAGAESTGGQFHETAPGDVFGTIFDAVNWEGKGIFLLRKGKYTLLNGVAYEFIDGHLIGETIRDDNTAADNTMIEVVNAGAAISIENQVKLSHLYFKPENYFTPSLLTFNFGDGGTIIFEDCYFDQLCLSIAGLATGKKCLFKNCTFDLSTWVLPIGATHIFSSTVIDKCEFEDCKLTGSIHLSSIATGIFYFGLTGTDSYVNFKGLKSDASYHNTAILFKWITNASMGNTCNYTFENCYFTDLFTCHSDPLSYTGFNLIEAKSFTWKNNRVQNLYYIGNDDTTVYIRDMFELSNVTTINITNDNYFRTVSSPSASTGGYCGLDTIFYMDNITNITVDNFITEDYCTTIQDNFLYGSIFFYYMNHRIANEQIAKNWSFSNLKHYGSGELNLGNVMPRFITLNAVENGGPLIDIDFGALFGLYASYFQLYVTNGSSPYVGDDIVQPNIKWENNRITGGTSGSNQGFNPFSLWFKANEDGLVAIRAITIKGLKFLNNESFGPFFDGTQPINNMAGIGAICIIYGRRENPQNSDAQGVRLVIDGLSIIGDTCSTNTTQLFLGHVIYNAAEVSVAANAKFYLKNFHADHCINNGGWTIADAGDPIENIGTRSAFLVAGEYIYTISCWKNWTASANSRIYGAGLGGNCARDNSIKYTIGVTADEWHIPVGTVDPWLSVIGGGGSIKVNEFNTTDQVMCII